MRIWVDLKGRIVSNSRENKIEVLGSDLEGLLNDNFLQIDFNCLLK